MGCTLQRGSKENLKGVEWMWQSNQNPWTKSEPAEWSHFSDLENLIIEDAFTDKKPRVLLDDYYVDFQNYLQVFNTDNQKQRLVKRVESKREYRPLTEARLTDLPTTSTRSFGGQYGWISPFVVEVRRDLDLKHDELPSRDSNMIPMLVEKAACGIIEEGKYLGKEREAEKMANMLREKKNENIKEVWKCCAYLYTLESFLYGSLNAAMRLVGDKDQEDVWRRKIRTLGPFCLLLWDDPINIKVKSGTTLYRGAELNPKQIAAYEEMVKNHDESRSFQAFSSCSRNRQQSEKFGNTLFIMKVCGAFTADLCGLSEYSNEEEELITPGVCFFVTKIKFDRKKKKHLIHLSLFQSSSGKLKKAYSKVF
ncbi:unnamed protein product [Rotaria sp. Silwood1]|nr:unnamed protein product [Rotaria sp. Silwood1]CAF1660981.1 unnamed protein product [Rotaria sp. Silwood1]CAF4962726.1 unnamed protein product [Rotaria sp. Silwood1]